jgi:hypothetical protein
MNIKIMGLGQLPKRRLPDRPRLFLQEVIRRGGGDICARIIRKGS